jgi:hypothetical protein
VVSHANQGQVGNQKIVTATTIGSQNLGYATAGGYQQSLNDQQSYGFGTNILQSP